MMKKTSRKPFNFFATVTALILALLLLVAAVPSSLLATSDIATSVTYGDSSATQITDGGGALSGDTSGNNTGTSTDKSGSTPADSSSSLADTNGNSAPQPSGSTAAATNASLPTAAADTTRPQIFALTPADGAITGPSIDISMDYSDSESGIFTSYTMPMIHVDNVHQECGVNNPNSCTITSSRMSSHKSGLSDGSHTLQAFVRDNAFNFASATWHVIVDATPPVITGAQPTGRINSSATTITASFNDIAGAGFNSAPSGVDPASATVAIDGQNVSCTIISSTGVSCPVTGLQSGNHSAQIEVSDLVGNRATYPWNFEIDTAAIGVSGQAPTDRSWQTVSSPIVAAALQPAGTGIIDTGSITMLLDGEDVSTMASRQSDGVTYTPLDLDEGWHTIELTLHDDLGHEGHSEWSFAVDTIRPQIQATQPTGLTSAQPTILAAFSDGGSGIDTRSINLLLDGENRIDAATLTSEGIAFPLPERLASGSHSVQLMVQDLAGNQQTSAWSFSVPETQAASGSVTSPISRQISVFSYWFDDSTVSGSSSGSWTISGFPAFPNTYFLPWYDSGPAAVGLSDEIAIRNDGAGEASVNVFVGGENKWQGKVAEGATETCRMPGAIGGPVKIICPTGQPLSVTHRLARGGMVNESQAVPEEAMDSVLLLPWYEAPADGKGNAAIFIANAGDQDAAVDVYVGDPMLPESLKGHYSIGPSAAAQAEFPETAGGPVRIVSTSNQPLVAELRMTGESSISVIPAVGFSQLQDRYQMRPPSSAAGHKTNGIYLGNGNEKDLTVELRIGDEQLRDPDDNNSDFFTITRQSTRAIDIPELNDTPLEIVCTNCSLGEGFAAGWISP
jgi:hypothetical protein